MQTIPQGITFLKLKKTERQKQYLNCSKYSQKVMIQFQQWLKKTQVDGMTEG
jgi:hypothetical protein